MDQRAAGVPRSEGKNGAVEGQWQGGRGRVRRRSEGEEEEAAAEIGRQRDWPEANRRRHGWIWSDTGVGKVKVK